MTAYDHYQLKLDLNFSDKFTWAAIRPSEASSSKPRQQVNAGDQANDAKSPPSKAQQDPAPNTIADLKKKLREMFRGLSIHDDEGYIAAAVEFPKAKAMLKRLKRSQRVAQNRQSGDSRDRQRPGKQAESPRRNRFERDEDAGYHIEEEESVQDGGMRGDSEYRKLDALLHPNHTADPLKRFDLGKWIA